MRASLCLLALGLLPLALPACGGGNGNAVEVCNAAGDEDGDGLANCADPDCAGDAACTAIVTVEGVSAPESAFFDPGTNAWYVSNQGGNAAGDGFISMLDAD